MKAVKLLIILFLSSEISLNAQDAFISTGGDVLGSSGSEAFSVGLLVYTEISGSGGTAAQGIQFAHELYVINVREMAIDLLVTVYPNPSNEQLNVLLKTKEEYQYRLYNTLGLNLYSGKLREGTTTIEVGNLPAGLYLLDILQENKSIKNYKIIKK